MKARKIIVCCDRKEDVESLMEYKKALAQKKEANSQFHFLLLEKLEAKVAELAKQGKVRVDDAFFLNCLEGYPVSKTSVEYKSFKTIWEAVVDLEGDDKIRFEVLNRSLAEEKSTLYRDIDVLTKTNVEFVVCNTYNELKSIQKINEYDGLVVPCELEWANEEGCSQRFMGITLVQHLREKGVSIPIVFTSVLSREAIVDMRKDADIIKTPALQHKFINYNDWEAIVNAFDGMRSLNDVELKYVQLLYCGLSGMLKKIKHSIRTNSNTDEYREQIKYVIDKAFPNDQELLVEFNQSDNLELFCQKLIWRLDNVTQSAQKNEIDEDFLCADDEEPIKIIYLEDNENSDCNVHRFVEYVKQKNAEVDKRNKGKKRGEPKAKYRFAPVVIKTTKEDLEKYYKSYNVIIVDIDIRNKDNELVALGFEVVRHLIEDQNALSHVYYIVTNVTRSFYDQIKIPGVRHTRLKEEVFGSDEKIERFLYGIKEAVDVKQAIPSDCQFIQDKLCTYIKNGMNYPICYKFKYMKEEKELTGYDELYAVVRTEALVLIKYFLSNCAKQIGITSCSVTDNIFFKIFDKVSKTTQEYIGERKTGRLGRGNGKLVPTMMENKNDAPSPSNVNAFIVKLVLRRFFLYVREFIRHYQLKEKGDALYYYDEGHEVTENDLACRAVNGTKGMFVEYKEEGSNQSKCLTETLMLSESEEELEKMLIKEEKEFVAFLKKQGENAFDFSSVKKIENLQFAY